MQSNPASPTARRISIRWLVTFALGVLFSGMLLTFVGNSADWKLAAGLNELEAGNVDAAIEHLQQAIDATKNNAHIKLQLARIYAENEQAVLGLCLCDQVLEEYPDSVAARITRSECLQYLERFDEALEDYQKSIAETAERTIAELNNLAYFRALARKDLTQAARQIEEAIEKIRGTYWGSPYIAVPLQVRTVVAMGLVSRHVHEETLALEQLDYQIDKTLRQWRRDQATVKQLTTVLADLSFPLEKPQLNRIDIVRSHQQTKRDSLGLMLTVRALLHQGFGSPKCVAKDIRILEELDLDFDQLKTELPSESEALVVLETAMTFLDTRGVVNTRLRWQKPEVHRWAGYLGMRGPGMLSSYEIALEDLNLAVVSAELYSKAIDSPLFNRYELPPNVVERKRQASRRSIAVLRYHRLEAHLKQNNQSAASADKARIQELGLAPDAKLF